MPNTFNIIIYKPNTFYMIIYNNLYKLPYTFNIIIHIPNTFLAAKSRCTIPKCSKYSIPYYKRLNSYL